MSKCPNCKHEKDACICDELEDKQMTFNRRYLIDARRRQAEAKQKRIEKRKEKEGKENG